MYVERFDSADAFYQKAEPYLLQHEAENNLIIGVATNWVKQNPTKDAYFALVYDDHQTVVGAALRTPPYRATLAKTAHPDAVRLLVKDLAEVYQNLPAVSGIDGDGAQFAQIWNELTGQTTKLGMPQRIYKLERLIPVEGVAGEARPATQADYDLLLRWMYEFSEEAFEHAPDPDLMKSAVENRLRGPGGFFIWEVDGSPVALAGYTGFTPNGVRIGPVYTPVDCRKRGYGSAVTAAVTKYLLDNGRKFCFLFTDANNPTSNHIYQSIGYEHVCNADEYLFS